MLSEFRHAVKSSHTSRLWPVSQPYPISTSLNQLLQSLFEALGQLQALVT